MYNFLRNFSQVYLVHPASWKSLKVNIIPLKAMMNCQPVFEDNRETISKSGGSGEGIGVSDFTAVVALFRPTEAKAPFGVQCQRLLPLLAH